MKVLNLRCGQGHVFEGWFGSDDDFADQSACSRIECPLCADREIMRLPSAPRLNLSGSRSAPPEEPAPPEPGLQVAWVAAMRRLIETTEDVGERFADEARRIHYGETEPRGIRGQATPEQRSALLDEGIEIVALPVPAALKGTLQ